MKRKISWAGVLFLLMGTLAGCVSVKKFGEERSRDSNKTRADYAGRYEVNDANAYGLRSLMDLDGVHRGTGKRLMTLQWVGASLRGEYFENGERVSSAMITESRDFSMENGRLVRKRSFGRGEDNPYTVEVGIHEGRSIEWYLDGYGDLVYRSTVSGSELLFGVAPVYGKQTSYLVFKRLK
ncbi:hypothetical protein [Phragmitibacter flavus]|uniref:hypothetical protein n=1 Tax=Phragmitibacter flavus TaxID=2576071 RepID=UPI0010FEBAB4|nr:hypothetical protein [Phragmitibacter flavus]